MPLSGGDRRAYVRELKRVEQLHAELERKVTAAYAAADEHLRLAHRIACEEWNARLWLGGDIEPSPQIQHAIDAGCTLLEVRCGQCRAIRRIDLGEVIWPRDKPVHTLRRALFCEPCRAATAVNFRPDGGRKFRPALIALLMPEPHAQPPVAARAARR